MRGDAEWSRRVQTTRLDRDRVCDLPADEVLERLEGADDLVAARRLSTITVGAPIIAEERRRRRRAPRPRRRSSTGPLSRIACLARRPDVGVASASSAEGAAPTERSSRLSSPTSRNDLPPSSSSPTALTWIGSRWRKVGERHLLDVDDRDAPGFAPAATALLVASSFAWASASSRGSWSSEKTRSTSPPICAIAAPIAFATAKCSGLTSCDAPGSESSSRIEPPPTITTGTSPALVFIRSTDSAICVSIKRRERSTRAVEARRPGPRGRSLRALPPRRCR